MNRIGVSTPLILLGAPCCGKGSLAQRIVSELPDLLHLSTGEIFRSHLNSNTPFGVEIAQCMQEGKLIPDSLVTNLVLQRLQPLRSGFILDGFPRTLEQAKELEAVVPTPTVVHLDANEETVIERLVGRLSCGSCGTVFNVRFAPPKKPGVCDSCAQPLVHRADDTREIAVQRLAAYHEHADAVLKFYKERQALICVPTEDLLPDEIFERVVTTLD